MSRKTVLVVNDIRDCGESYYVPFAKFGRYETDPDLLRHRPRDIALVVFTGGADVSPDVYGHTVQPECGRWNSKRDEQEQKVFKWAKALNIPMAGICRGSQLLCALNGGVLYQHITNHHGVHKILTHDGRKFLVSSTHHQLANPTDLVSQGKAKVLGWAYPRLSSEYVLGTKAGGLGFHHKSVVPDVEYEVVYYPESNSIGFQYHPEAMDKASKGFQYTVEMCEKHLGLKPEED